jgi:hypothetical protein
VAGTPASAQAPTSVRVPTPRDAINAARAAGLLPQAIRTPNDAIPGTIADEETVQVELDPSGRPVGVQVAQRLIMNGVGDYFFQVAGPATNVSALPESASEPSLRQGAIVWQGFASGREVLASAVEMSPDLVARRLPVQVELAVSVGGRLARPGQKATGPLALRLSLVNVSSIPVKVSAGDADPARVAPLLDAARNDLAKGTPPRPGDGAIPRAIPVNGPIKTTKRSIQVPFRIEGSLVFPADAVQRLALQGGTAQRAGPNIVVRFAALLGGGQPARHDISIVGLARGLGTPRLDVTATPALPSNEAVQPPGWQQALTQDPAAFDGADMLRRLMGVMWQVATVRVFDSFLGNPDARGTATTVYRYRLAPPAPVATVPDAGGFSVVGAVGFSLAGIAVLYLLAVIWARS